MLERNTSLAHKDMFSRISRENGVFLDLPRETRTAANGQPMTDGFLHCDNGNVVAIIHFLISMMLLGMLFNSKRSGWIPVRGSVVGVFGICDVILGIYSKPI